ncbi:MAG: DNA-3-methyladenine glycosylase I [Pseudomonadota bacterium]
MTRDYINNGLNTRPDGRPRCAWHGGHADYMAYHDTEWGWPVFDDQRLFEKICLEGFQSGLSWLTILRKRENFRTSFEHFDFHKIARYGDAEIAYLIVNPGIIRHRRKIESTINNARRACDLVNEFGSLSRYFWQFVPPQSERPDVCDYVSLRRLNKTPTSIRLSRDLKQRGWSFVGPVTAYAFMQAMGLVNDHIEGCHVREQVEQAQLAARAAQ